MKYIKMTYTKLTISVMFLVMMFSSCEFLDVIPDNIATLEHAFADETTAERYLFTCYAGIPSEHSISSPAWFGGGEVHFESSNDEPYSQYFDVSGAKVVRGLLSPVSVNCDWYPQLYQTIRKTFIFENNLDKAVGLEARNEQRWKAEVKAIRAYCYYLLLRQYGPIPLITKEYALDASEEEVRVARTPFDQCINYVVDELNSAMINLPARVEFEAEELGRITKVIAASLKAKVLTMAASPLYNGFNYYRDWKNIDGTLLFSAKDENKWQLALDACKYAIDLCDSVDIELFKYTAGGTDISPERLMEHTVRGTITDEKWNSELIWGDVTNISQGLQNLSVMQWIYTYDIKDPYYASMGVPMKMVNKFYTENGIPMEEDPDWVGVSYLELVMPEDKHEGWVKKDEVQPQVNLNREGRFYGSLTFNRAKLYGSGNVGNESHIMKCFLGESGNLAGGNEFCAVTGYMPRKILNLRTTMTGGDSHLSAITVKYPFPRMRLADIYLLYAECSNEVNGPIVETKKYIDLVRNKAGLKGVDESWSESINPGKTSEKIGMREIIKRERMIELMFECNYFWDVRRWGDDSEFNLPLIGFNRFANKEEVENYYTETVLLRPRFGNKDYFWPISNERLLINPNLVQAKGW